MIRIGSLILGCVVSWGIGSPLEAQEGRPPVDLLRGPDVDRGARESNLGMLENGAMQRAIRRTSVPTKRWFSECDALELTPAQRKRIRELGTAFKKRSDAYLAEHGDRLRTLRRLIRAHENGRRSDEAPERHQERLLERDQLQAGQPQVTTLQQTVWNLLTLEQQEAFRTRLASVREEIRRRQAIERLKEQGGVSPVPMQGEDNAMAPEGMGGSPLPERPDAPERRPGSLEGFD